MSGGNAWTRNHPWARVYDFVTGNEAVGRVAWRLGVQSDINRLYAATEEIGTLPAGSSVLDLPCGGGVALRGVRAGQDVRYVAADIAPDMLGRTRREAERRDVEVELLQADVADLPFDDATFDLVVAFTSLHCFPDPERGVAELIRVLKPGGVLSGSALLINHRVLSAPFWIGGRASGLLGPGASPDDLRRWMRPLTGVMLERAGAITYFHGRRP